MKFPLGRDILQDMRFLRHNREEVPVVPTTNYLDRQFGAINLALSAIPLAKLYLFSRYPETRNMYSPLRFSDEATNNLQRISGVERGAKQSILPPIGTEIEVLFHTLRRIDPRKDLAAKAGYRVYMDGREHEFAAPASYSWQTQAAMVDELYEMGAVTDDPGSEPKHFHINLRLPLGFENDTVRLNFETDAQIFAFVTGLPFATSANFAFPKETITAVYTHKKADALPDERISDRMFRLETRISKLSRATVARNLEYAQKMAACFFSFMKRGLGQSITSQEASLAAFWETTKQKFMERFHSSIDYPLLYGADNIVKWERALIDQPNITGEQTIFMMQALEQIDSILQLQ